LSLECLALPTPNAPLLVSTTLTLAMFTTLVQGATMKPLLKFLGVTGGKSNEIPLLDPLSSSYGGVTSDDPTGSPPSPNPVPEKWWSRLDDRYFIPFFVANPSITGGTTKRKFTELGRTLASLTYERDAHDKKQLILLDMISQFSKVDAEDRAERQRREKLAQEAEAKEQEILSASRSRKRRSRKRRSSRSVSRSSNGLPRDASRSDLGEGGTEEDGRKNQDYAMLIEGEIPTRY